LAELPDSADSLDHTPRFSAKAIRKAIFALESIVGRATVDALICDFERQGLMVLSDDQTYSLGQIRNALEDLFGVESGSILLARLTKELFKQ
jgi:hypothetical protein